MSIPFRPLAPVAAAIALSTLAWAQVRLESHGPIRHARYDLATGRVTRSGPALEAGGPTVTYSNTNVSPFFTATGLPDEWQDWGLKTGGESGLVCELRFGYGSRVPDDPPAVPGPVSVELALFAGTTGDCDGGLFGPGGKGTEVARIVMSGLPGDVDTGDGLPSTWIISVDLGQTPIVLPDGPIGWSYVFPEALDNGPLLVHPSNGPESCGPPGFSGISPDTTDCVDVYSPGAGGAGACRAGGPFSFGTPGTTSFYLELVEATAQAASATPRFASPANPGFFASSTMPIVGTSWSSTILAPAVSTPLLDILAIALFPDPGTFVPGLGTLLISLPIALEASPPTAGFSIPIPFECTRIGLGFSVQAAQLDLLGAVGLTNAEDLVLGTF